MRISQKKQIRCLALSLFMLVGLSGVAQERVTLNSFNTVINDDGIIQSCSYDFSKNIDGTILIIPEQINGTDVKGIKETYPAIFRKKGIVELKLPETFEDTIVFMAFSGNPLTSVNIPEGVTFIRYGVFNEDSLVTVDLPNSLTYIEQAGFYQNKITSLKMGNNLTYIGDWAFAYNNLTSVDIPNSVTYIGEAAFSFNQNLPYFVLPKPFGLIVWEDGDGNQYEGGDIILQKEGGFDKSYTAKLRSYYTLQDEDVVIDENGYIQRCFYSFANKDIFIPDVLQGIVVKGIARGTETPPGSNKFRGKGITSVRLPNHMVTLSGRGFLFNQLTDIKLPESLLHIDSFTLYGNDLGSVVIPPKVTFIGREAFYNTGLSEISLPESVTKIEARAFAGNPNLPYFILPSSEGLSVWEDSDGNYHDDGDTIFQKNGGFNKTYTTKSYYTLQDKDVTMENGVIISCSYDFSNPYIKIPTILGGDTVKGIPDDNKGPFSEKGIRGVELPTTLDSVGQLSFRNNELTSIEIPNGVTAIKGLSFAFNQLTSIEIPNSVTYIGKGAFAVNKLTHLTIGDGVTAIHEFAFLQNELVSVNIPNSVTYIGRNIFGDNDNLPYFILPTPEDLIVWEGSDGKTYEGGDTIFQKDRGFSHFYAAKLYYTLQDKDVTMVYGTLKSCSYDFSNPYIRIPDTLDGKVVKEISAGGWFNEGVFAEKGIRGVKLPSTLEMIGFSTFRDNLLTEIDIPNSVTVVAGWAFQNNENLPHFILPTPDDLSLWEDFDGKTYEGGDTIFQKNGGFDKSYVAQFYYTLQDEDVTMEDGVLSSCSYDFSNPYIRIPDTLDGQVVKSVAQIGWLDDGVFAGKGIRGVKLPSTLKVIWITTFEDNLLTKIDIPNNVTTIIAGAFRRNENLPYFILPTPDDLSFWESTGGVRYEGGDTIFQKNGGFDKSYVAQFYYTLQDEDVTVEDGILRSCSYDFSNPYIRIPDTLDGQVVKEISTGRLFNDGVFAEKGIRGVKLPSTLELLGFSTFSDNLLTEIDIPNSVNRVLISFYNNKNLPYFILPTPDDLIFWEDEDGGRYEGGDTVFQKNGGFGKLYFARLYYTLQDEDVTMEDGVIQASSYSSFYQYIKIPSVLQGQVVKGISTKIPGAFGDKNLLGVKLPSTLEVIGAAAFRDNSLTTIDIPNSVTAIWYRAFHNNENLPYFTLPTPEQLINWVDLGQEKYDGGDKVFQENGGFDDDYRAILDVSNEEEMLALYSTFDPSFGQISIQVENESCPDNNDGEITIVNNEDSDITVQLNGGVVTTVKTKTSYVYNSIQTGSYIVTLTSGSASKDIEVMVTEPQASVIEVTVSSVYGNPEALKLYISGGNAPYMVKVDDRIYTATSNIFSIEGVSGGAHNLEVSDENGCNKVYTEQIYVMEDVTYYPNPVVDELTIALPEGNIIDGIYQVKIVNVGGNPLASYSLSNVGKELKIPFRTIPQGICLVHITKPDGAPLTGAIKVVVER